MKPLLLFLFSLSLLSAERTTLRPLSVDFNQDNLDWKLAEEKVEKKRLLQKYLHAKNDFPHREESVTIEVIDSNFKVKKFLDAWMKEIKERDKDVVIELLLKSPKDVLYIYESSKPGIDQICITRIIQEKENIQIISYRSKLSMAITGRLNRWIKIMTEIKPTFKDRKSGVRSITGTPESARGIRIGK